VDWADSSILLHETSILDPPWCLRQALPSGLNRQQFIAQRTHCGQQTAAYFFPLRCLLGLDLLVALFFLIVTDLLRHGTPRPVHLLAAIGSISESDLGFPNDADYQACNPELCWPPRTVKLNASFDVAQ